MPELPDITAYTSALETRIVGQTLERARLGSVFLLRTVDPPLSAAEGEKRCGSCGGSGSASPLALTTT